MAQQPPRLGWVAGEASGDLLAGLVLQGLYQRWPGMRNMGIGGPRMLAQGFETWWPQDKLAVHGYAEALRHYRELVAIRRALGSRLLAERPDVFIGVDAPDFNLGLEARLKQGGIKTIHFVSPSVWAWRGGRVDKIGAAVDRILCLFPFEPEIYQAHGIEACYVGHPLADTIPLQPPRAQSRATLGVGERDIVVALLPGSRGGEIAHIAPVFAQAAGLLKQARPDLTFLLPVAPGRRAAIEAAIAQHAPDVGIRLVDGRSHEVLAASDVTLIASGTATLEAALFKCPMVIAYRMSFLSWQIMKRMRYQPWVGLPNILLREFVVPELLQHEASAENLAREALAWLDRPARVAQLRERFDQLHHQLRCNTVLQVSNAIAQTLGH